MNCSIISTVEELRPIVDSARTNLEDDILALKAERDSIKKSVIEIQRTIHRNTWYVRLLGLKDPSDDVLFRRLFVLHFSGTPNLEASRGHYWEVDSRILELNNELDEIKELESILWSLDERSMQIDMLDYFWLTQLAKKEEAW